MHGVQSTISFNVPHHLDEQAKTIAEILRYVKKNSFVRVEASEEAEQFWVDQVISSGQKVSTMNGDPCTPGYYNNEGQPKKKWSLLSRLWWRSNPLFQEANGMAKLWRL